MGHGVGGLDMEGKGETQLCGFLLITSRASAEETPILTKG